MTYTKSFMVIKDQKIEQMIKEGKTIEIEGELLKIIANRRGSCDGCYFDQFEKPYPHNNCPKLAVTICCSNGGNIFEKVEKNGR